MSDRRQTRMLIGRLAAEMGPPRFEGEGIDFGNEAFVLPTPPDTRLAEATDALRSSGRSAGILASIYRSAAPEGPIFYLVWIWMRMIPDSQRPSGTSDEGSRVTPTTTIQDLLDRFAPDRTGTVQSSGLLNMPSATMSPIDDPEATESLRALIPA